MTAFIKNFKEVLPYNRVQYIDFLGDEYDPSCEWSGVSFQIKNEGKKNGLTEFINNYEGLFRKVVLKIDNGSEWIVNHDDKDMNWLPNNEDNLTSLRTLFKQRNIPNSFIGALIFETNDLLEFSRDLIAYPFAIYYKEGKLYKNIDISHGELQFIIKISGHMNIDFLSTNKEILREVVYENSSNAYNVKYYRGTSL